MDTNIQVPIRIDKDGVWRVGDTRVPIDTILTAYHQGAVPEEIVFQYPTLSLVDIYTVIAYYLNNRESVETYLAQRQREAEAIRAKIERNSDVAEIRARLLARQAARNQSGDATAR